MLSENFSLRSAQVRSQGQVRWLRLQKVCDRAMVTVIDDVIDVNETFRI